MAYDNPQIEELFTKSRERMEKTLSAVKNEFQNIRAGRANPHILDKITVDYYGTETSITQMANISVPEARMIVISVWDASATKDVEKAILAANIGLTPNNDGKVLRLIFPEITEERRKEIAKQVKKIGEDGKIALRNERREILESLKKLNKEKTIPDDAYELYEKDVEKQMNKYSDMVENLVKEKEKEVLTV